MKASEWFPFFIAGFVFGAGTWMAILTVDSSYHSQAKTAKLECEKSLPRDQHCKIVAVPKAAGEK